MLTIERAKLRHERHPWFEGQRPAIRTDVLVDKAAEELYPHWKERIERVEADRKRPPVPYLGRRIRF